MASSRIQARFYGPWPSRFRQSSSRNVTSSIQCNVLSTNQWSQMQVPLVVAPVAARLQRK